LFRAEITACTDRQKNNRRISARGEGLWRARPRGAGSPGTFFVPRYFVTVNRRYIISSSISYGNFSDFDISQNISRLQIIFQSSCGDSRDNFMTARQGSIGSTCFISVRKPVSRNSLICRSKNPEISPKSRYVPSPLSIRKRIET